MLNGKRVVSALRVLRFAAGGALICAAVTGAVGLDDTHQATLSAVGFAGVLAAKLAHII